MKWIIPNKYSGDDVINYILKSRSIQDKSRFLSPKEDHLPNPLELFDVQSAAKFIIESIKNKKKIFIHGDFDVDGVTATSILWRFLYNDLGYHSTLPYIPSRFDEGYGLSKASLDSIVKQGGEVVITVDCGIKDLEIVHNYKEKVDFIITDHHTVTLAGENNQDLKGVNISGHFVPKGAKAVVHPKLNNQSFSEICGAAVAWKLCSAINIIGEYGVDTNKYLDLVSLATVCDIMPLIEENRTYVALGLNRLKSTQNEGLKALCKICEVNLSKIDTYHLGYVLGPRINAAGRLGHAMDSVRLLCTDSEKEATKYASKLHSLNQERQRLTQVYYEKALKQIEKQANNNLLFVYGGDWPEGVVGLIAGKLCQEINKPVLAASLKNGVLKGSARSIRGYNIADALKHGASYLQRFGGHAQAAGFTLSQVHLTNFLKQIVSHANSNINPQMVEKVLRIDALLYPNEVSLSLARSLQGMAPFGLENATPSFALDNIQLTNIKKVGKETNHISASAKVGSGIAKVIGFNMAHKLEEVDANSPLQIAVNIEIDEWNGYENISLRLIDFGTNKF